LNEDIYYNITFLINKYINKNITLSIEILIIKNINKYNSITKIKKFIYTLEDLDLK
jgi:hypothetical protein